MTARAVRGEPLFADDIDRAWFLDLFGRVCEDARWRCHGFCLMTNHFHLALETPAANLSAGMHRLNSRYANRFNTRHGFRGHLLDRRFYSGEVASEWHLLELLRYVVLNPVRAGLCFDPADWPWSSYPAVLGLIPSPRFLAVDYVLAYFGRTLAEARAGFRQFVAEAPGRGA